MKKAICFFALFAVFFLIIPGCRKKNSVDTSYRAVTQIDIVTKQQDALLRRHYTDPQKMQSVLVYLRLLTPTGKPEVNPEHLTDDMFLVALTFSDGSNTYYRQTGHRYVSKDDGSWFSIAPEHAVRLYELMAHTPSDIPAP